MKGKGSMKMEWFIQSALVIAVLAAAGCDSSGEGRRFGHNSPRPACEYTIDPARAAAAYFPAPVLVAAGWSAPVKLAAPINTDCPEDAIEISRDGKTLYFFWAPTVNPSGEVLLDIETGTYRADRVGTNPATFANPRYYDLQMGVTGGSVDAELSFNADGSKVYFHSTRSANTGYLQDPPVDDILDIYVADVLNNRPGAAVNLGAPVNTIYRDGEHALSPDATRLYLASNRPGGQGDDDIWVSTQSGGVWGTPVNLGTPINSTGKDLQPAFAANDPDTMYFASDRAAGVTSIYRSTWNGSAWSAPEMILTGFVGEPTLVSDGNTLYFVHVLVDGTGVFGADIWYVQKL